FIFLLIFLVYSMPGHAGDIIETPLEKKQYSDLTSYIEMMNYLKLLDQGSRVFNMEIIGQSVEGRDIPALYFTLDKKFGSKRDVKPLVLIFCQQHGDEPSGKEAALFLARKLSGSGNKLLEKLDLILVPQVNPDGAEKNQRRNANEMDLNRNHIILSEPETRAIHDIFLKWMPDVTLDVHEYGSVSKTWISHGFIKDADEQFGKLSNINISENILRFSRDIILPAVGNRVKNDGFTFHEYVVGTPFAESRLRYSTTAINDGRQSLGIFNTLSFILEGKQYGDVITHIKQRTEGQLSAITAFLLTVSEHNREIIEIVTSARKNLVEDNSGRAFIQMDYYPDSSQMEIVFPVFNLETWKREEKTLKNFHSQVKVRKSIEKPRFYMIPGSEKTLLDILSRHQIKMRTIEKDTILEVESYKILHVTSFIEEELEVPYVDIMTEMVS
ncbi:MAG: DUF2817 domain-containing protein, partial [Calditrichaeota bacterium]